MILYFHNRTKGLGIIERTQILNICELYSFLFDIDLIAGK